MSLPPIDAACAEAVIVSSSLNFPLSIASQTSSIVITFVMDAQGRCSCGFFSNNILPDEVSISTADGAVIVSSVTALTSTENTGIAVKIIAIIKANDNFFYHKNTSFNNMNEVWLV